MYSAMDVRIFLFIVANKRIDYRLRLLRGGGIIQIDQWIAPYGLAKDWEILSYRLHVKSGLWFYNCFHAASSCRELLFRLYNFIQVVGSVQNLEQQALEPIPERFDLHPLYNVAREGIGQQRAGIFQPDASCAQVE